MTQIHPASKLAWQEQAGQPKTQTCPDVTPLRIRLKYMVWRAVVMMIVPFLAVTNVLIAIINCISDRCTCAFRVCRGATLRGRDLFEGENSVDEFDIDAKDFSFKKVRDDYINHSIPVVLYSSASRISCAAPPDEGVFDGTLQVLMDTVFRRFPGLDEIVRAVFPCHVRTTPPLWFLGNYTKGLAHIDVMNASFDCYYLVRGKKDVVIVPHFLTWKMKNLRAGTDNWFVPGSTDPIKGYDYLKDVKSYYRFEMREDTVLIFNSSGCLHHFTNIYDEANTKSPQALVLHPGHATHSDPRGWLSMGCNPRVWLRHSQYAAQAVMNGIFGANLVLPRKNSSK